MKLNTLYRHASAALAFSMTVIGTLAGAPSAYAQSDLIVGGTAATEGNAFNFRVLSSASAVTQVVIDASALSALPTGSILSGIAFRLDGTATQSTPALNFVDYDIFLGQAGLAAASSSNTFLDNYSAAGPRTQVRNGALSFAAGAFTASASAGPEAFGPTITFDAGYTYQGGGLILEVRHTGNGATSLNVDGIAPSGSITSRDNVPSTAPGGAVAGAPITQFMVSAASTAPEPNSGSLLGLLAIAGVVFFARHLRRA